MQSCFLQAPPVAPLLCQPLSPLSKRHVDPSALPTMPTARLGTHGQGLIHPSLGPQSMFKVCLTGLGQIQTAYFTRRGWDTCEGAKPEWVGVGDHIINCMHQNI